MNRVYHIQRKVFYSERYLFPFVAIETEFLVIVVAYSHRMHKLGISMTNAFQP